MDSGCGEDIHDVIADRHLGRCQGEVREEHSPLTCFGLIDLVFGNVDKDGLPLELRLIEDEGLFGHLVTGHIDKGDAALA